MKHKFGSANFKKPLFALFGIILISGIVLAFAQPASAFNRFAAESSQLFSSGPAQAVLEPNMGRIYKAASKQEVTLGELLTFTIHLELDLSTSLKLSVTDPLPKELEYIPGSANYGGVYDPATRTVTWAIGVNEIGTPVDLKFDVKDTVAVKEPTPVVNTATIDLNGYILQRQAWVTLMPEGADQSDLSGSFKIAKPRMLYAGETVIYSIRLINSGTEPAIAQVVDPVPGILTYVPGSANNDGYYDPGTKAIIWKDVLVQPYSQLLPVEPVTLSFAAKAPNAFIDVYPISPIAVTNMAIISSGNIAFKRSVEILVLPYPCSPLEGSYKTASYRSVFPGQAFTYSISLNNSSTAPVSAVVSDPLPPQVSYVAGSANANGQYDSATRTLTWKDLTVLEGSTLVLTFDVIAKSPSTDAASITNTAYIISGGITLKRSVTTPVQPPPVDSIPPVVRSLIIGMQDVNISPSVVLQIAAADNVGVRWMYLQEWVLSTDKIPHWQPVNSSGWVPYEAKYPWKLSEQPGAHYMAVWVADAAGNRSKLTRSSIDFASLLLPGTQAVEGELVPYLVYYPAGIDVTAGLKTLSGVADLFVWYPGNLFYPDQYTPTPGSNPQKISFTTKTAGIYLFLVYSVKASVFDLSITPGGGPRVPVLMSYGSTATDSGLLDDPATTNAVPELDGMTYNPILPQSGLDPLDVVAEPGGPYYQVFLPSVRR